MVDDDDDELIDDLPDDMPGAKEMQMSWDLFQALRALKKTDVDNGRVWAIAVTEAEKLHAWVAYAVGVANDPE
jgi:hypothetical protein